MTKHKQAEDVSGALFWFLTAGVIVSSFFSLQLGVVIAVVPYLFCVVRVAWLRYWVGKRAGFFVGSLLLPTFFYWLMGIVISPSVGEYYYYGFHFLQIWSAGCIGILFLLGACSRERLAS